MTIVAAFQTFEIVANHELSLTPLVLQVKALKEKIEAERGKDNFPVSGQKLIYAGKILQDDTPIKEYKIDEKNFVVVMVSKVRADRKLRISMANLTPALTTNGDLFF